jgi:hypothetical protein
MKAFAVRKKYIHLVELAGMVKSSFKSHVNENFGKSNKDG